MRDPIFIPGDAHEGCVWVADQNRLYFSSTRKVEERRVALSYLDFSPYALEENADWDSALEALDPEQMEIQEWIHDANMANSFCLTLDKQSLLVAEQGNFERPSVVSRIKLDEQHREVLIDNYKGKPFSSINKVMVSQRGHIIFSDPDYGFRQNFRPPPVLESSLYVIPENGETYAFDCGLEMPHGITLSPDERTLFVTDTSDDGAHDDKLQLKRRCSVHLFDFDPERGKISGPGRHGFSVDDGVPDGIITDGDYVLTGAGDGVYVADLNGKLQGKISLDHTAVNLCTVHDHLFVTADVGVYILTNWRQRVQALARH